MTQQAKILIVEDSPSQAAIIATVVKQAGHLAAVYSQLPMGITQILTVEQPDLVLLDLRLLDSEGKPMADGFQLCREIKRSSPGIPVIVVSAEGDEDACEWAVLQGADAYLQKPFAVEDLTTLMNQVLGE
ncbi:MAG: response regulator [Bdellovibrionota bacterium]